MKRCEVNVVGYRRLYNGEQIMPGDYIWMLSGFYLVETEDLKEYLHPEFYPTVDILLVWRKIEDE